MNNMLKSAAALGLVAIAGTTLLTGVDALTADRIAAQERRVILEQLGQIIPQSYDNPLLGGSYPVQGRAPFPKGATGHCIPCPATGRTAGRCTEIQCSERVQRKYRIARRDQLKRHFTRCPGDCP